ncbi:GntR family transcriptional regulator [Brevibacterium permense]|uniref:GntR family transcriptional regulator n=1 Tax=Brevibacterium permense TaxID=234834 RepID=UPI0021D39B57|nr:GntR family transcriptional regulator [Brevibacterium permense]MCU4298642.1 GntR family transcriptional regulator [Brevibacterium permense]
MQTVSVFSSKGSQAYSEVRRLILTGELKPGSRISQYELADDLQMSITPLREAVRRLASEGLVILGTHRDVRVAGVSSSEAKELHEVRLSLEPDATAMAAERRTEVDVERMRTAASRLVPVTRNWGDDGIAAHREFHRAVYCASHNEIMIRMLDDLWDKSDRYRRIGLELPTGTEPRMIDLNEHHEILDLIVSGDGAEASALARKHIVNSLTASVTDLLDDFSTGD